MSSCIILKLVDINNKNEFVDLDDLTDIGICEMIHQCDLLKDELEDKHREIMDDE